MDLTITLNDGIPIHQEDFLFGSSPLTAWDAGTLGFLSLLWYQPVDYLKEEPMCSGDHSHPYLHEEPGDELDEAGSHGAGAQPGQAAAAAAQRRRKRFVQFKYLLDCMFINKTGFFNPVRNVSTIF